MLSRDCDGCSSQKACGQRYKKAKLNDKVYCPDGTAHLIDSGSFTGLLNAVWCPICGAKLSVQEHDGKKSLHCSEHGDMKAFLDLDPKAEVKIIA